MAVNLSPVGGVAQQFFTNNGVPLSGGLIYTYTAGSTTPATTYTSSTGTIAHTNPIVLDSGGRVPGGEVWLTNGVAYKFVLNDSNDVLIATYDNVAGINDSTALLAYEAALAASSGSSLIGYQSAGGGAVATTVQTKLRQYVSVKDFGAVGDGVTDDTAAFTAAQQASKNVYIPPGDYALANLRIYNAVQLIGGGQDNTILRQLNTGDYVINCLSDAVTGQLGGLNLSAFRVVGKPGATVEAVRISANGVYAIWHSNFEFFAKDTYTAANIQGPTAANVFRCNFKITSEGSTSVAVVDAAGVYNTFDLFCTQCQTTAVTAESGESQYRIVTDQIIYMDGRGQVLINPTVEYIEGTAAYNAAIYLNGIDQTVINASVNATDAIAAAKVTYAFRSGTRTTWISPYIIGLGIVANPFAPTGDSPFTIIGPVRSNTTNKMETIWDGSDNGKNLRNVTFVGDVSQITSTVTVSNGKTIQYTAPSTAFNLAVNPNTDACIIEPTGVIATCNISFPSSEPYDGQVFSFTFTNEVTAITWTTTAYNFTLIPTTAAAGAKFSIIYRKTNTKFYPI